MARGKATLLIRGGLGNQLHQFAIANQIALNLNVTLEIDARHLPRQQHTNRQGVTIFPFGLGGFADFETTVLTSKTRLSQFAFRVILEVRRRIANAPSLRKLQSNVITDEGKVPDSLAERRNIKLISLFSDVSITAQTLSVVKRQLGDPRNPSARFVDLRADMKRKRVLGIHIRRGDFVGLGHLYGEISSRWYFEQAQPLLSSHDEVVIFSDSNDDPVLEEALAGADYMKISPREIESPLETLVLLSNCTSLILSNSTFSWWATALGENLETVVFPIVDETLKSPFHDLSIRRLTSANLVGREIF